MNDEKLIELAKLVLQQSIHSNLSWEETADKNTYQATLSKFVIRIGSRSSKYDQGEMDYLFSLVNSDGVAIESFDDVQLSNWIKKSPIPSDVNGYVILQEIYKNAKRKALGVDEALNDVLKELQGLPPF
jgi:hypothetical protein